MVILTLMTKTVSFYSPGIILIRGFGLLRLRVRTALISLIGSLLINMKKVEELSELNLNILINQIRLNDLIDSLEELLELFTKENIYELKGALEYIPGNVYIDKNRILSLQDTCNTLLSNFKKIDDVVTNSCSNCEK